MQIRANKLYEKVFNVERGEKAYGELRVRSGLLKLKKSGVIFFKEELSSSPLDKKITLYHKVHPGTVKSFDAFPMPKYIYKKKSFQEELKCNLKFYYKNYYKEVLAEKDLAEYSLKPYIAKDVVWFHKN